MKKIINAIGVIVLCGILLKLSYVFIFLFGELDKYNFLSMATGVTFAFASVYFVVNVKSRWLKIIMVVLDICTILYFYLHQRFNIPIDFASIIIAFYSGLIVYYLGKIIATQIDGDSHVKALDKLENQHRIDKERLELEVEINKCRRRIRQSRTDETRLGHQKKLEELEKIYHSFN
ncbi:MAG: hypothetical protein LBG77_05555 [Dysgonamonadaceae bacterium]|jgi:hypothetical protein|nr:hypothetical protein [Dysgonamonadaceae bacterium]